jgi:acyl carrier protein
MTERQIYETLTAIFRDVFLRDDLDLAPALSAKDVPDWDSFKQIEIIIAVEERFGVKFRTREMDSLNNVGDLARLVADKTGQAPSCS